MANSNDSILESVKKALNVMPDYTEFDSVITMHINSVFGTLNQLGLGPDEGFMIEDASAQWGTYLSNDLTLNGVRSYMYMKVRMLFDPPETGFHLTAMEKMITEAESRLNMVREDVEWEAPVLPASSPAQTSPFDFAD